MQRLAGRSAPDLLLSDLRQKQPVVTHVCLSEQQAGVDLPVIDFLDNVTPMPPCKHKPRVLKQPARSFSLSLCVSVCVCVW